MMRKNTIVVLILAFWATVASCQQKPPQPEKPEGAAAQGAPVKEAGEKSLAYLIMVRKIQEDAPEYRTPGRGRALPGEKTGKQLDALGFKTREVAAFSPTLTLDYLKQFNVIVLGAGGEGNQHALLSKLADENAKVIFQYVKEGGGLLVLRNPGWQFGKDIQELNGWLRPTGIEVLPEEVVDEENSLALPSRYTICWTDNMAEHPVTKDVKGLFYPQARGGYRRYTDFSSPVKVGPEWAVVISGKATAHSTRRKKGSLLQPATPGTYKTKPPLMAVRQFGRGRIAVLPIASSCIWHDGYHALWGDGLVMDGTTKGMTGSGAKLLANVFTYLAEPSRGRFGGYVEKPPVIQSREERMRPLDWDKIQFGGIPRKHCFAGLIGARSALSSGKGQPEEFIEAAKEAKYDFIAFAEDLGKLTKEKFGRLQKICAEHSNKEFKAYPGYTYLDDSGNTWVTFSDKLTWPADGWFSSKYPGRLSCNNALIRGCGKPPVILTHSHRNPEAPWFQGNFNAMALFTYRNGEQIDDSVDHYLRLLRMSFRATPVVVHFVDSPDRVKQARAAGFQSYTRWLDDNIVEALHDFSPKHKGRHVWSRSSFVSEGPMIEDMRVANGGVTDLARIGRDRCRMRFVVSAPDGLKQVLIHDGDRKRPWRRFLLHGEKACDRTIDFFHDRQHDLVLDITDQEGRRAIGWNAGTRVQEYAFHRCSDNYNTMQRGKWWGEPKGMLNIRGFEDYLVVRNFLYCGTLRTAGLEETKRPAVEYYPELACRFGGIVDTLISQHYPPEASGNADHTDVPFCAEKNEYIAGKTRYTCYSGRQDSSVVQQVQGDYEVLKDYASKETLLFAGRGPSALCLCATPADGRFFAGQFTRTVRHFQGMLPERGYVALYPSAFNGSAGAIALQPGLRFTSHTGPDLRGGNVYLRLPENRKEFKRGERIRYEYLAVNSRLGGAPDNGFINDVVYPLGLAGKPAYSVAPTRGSVEDTRFVLTLKADGHGFAAKVSQAELPLDLPVRIGGLNPRWDAGILYKGESTLVIPESEINEFNERYVVRQERQVQNEILRFPVLEDGSGFLQIDTTVGEKDVYIGNLLVSDNPDVVLTLVDTRPDRAAFVAHNPGDQEMTCHVCPGPGFDLLGAFDKTVTVPAGSSATVKIADE